ncbi:unnamed protein product, partial [Vitis vinifera]|uniref:Uncharacterized protein n=1 Tax=Vitis vinifera TaxID=29760 RepID=D7TYU6_VITVI
MILFLHLFVGDIEQLFWISLSIVEYFVFKRQIYGRNWISKTVFNIIIYVLLFD